ncbi:WD40_repeat protein [Hexamita inflata]|uniref:WD40 repeat protein n=1 Tax=Hexamita inflata TaxID=28002 RepID=A0AA86U2L0_9EUKA|nr:WD40 repeat protein [Hexamita inflata]
MFPALNLRPVIKDSEDTVYSLSFSPDCQMIAAGVGDGSVQLYNVASGRRLFRLVSNTTRPTPVTSCCFRPKQQANEPQVLLASLSTGLIAHYNAFRGQLVSQFQCTDDQNQPVEIYSCKYNNDGGNFTAVGKDGRVRVYDETTQKLMMTLQEGNGSTTAGHSNRVFSLAYSDRNFNVIYTAGWDHTVQVWDMRVGHSVSSMHNVHVYGDALDVRDETLLVGNYNTENQLHLYDIRQPTQPALIKMVNWTSQAPQKKIVDDFDPTLIDKIQQVNQELLTNVKNADDENAEELRVKGQDDLKVNDPIRQEEVDTDEPTMIYDAKFGRTKDTYFACGSGGKEVRLYKNDKVAGMWKAPKASYCCACSPDGRFGAVAGNGYGVQVFMVD